MAKSPGNGSWHNNKNTKNLLVRRSTIDANDYEISVDLDFQAIKSGQGAALQLRKDDKKRN